MRFVLVNHKPPPHEATCNACSGSLGSSYLRHVPTQRRYCDYDCYRRHGAATMALPWFAPDRAVTAYRNAAELITVIAAISSWSWMMQIEAFSRSLTATFLSAHDLMMREGGDS